MTYLSRLFVLIFLTILCFNAEAAYLDTVKAQELEPTQEEDKSIPHAEVISRLLNFTGKSDEDCSLPCFADVRPGETTLSEIQALSVDLFNEDESILNQFDNSFERDDGLLAYSLISNSTTVTGYFALGFLIAPEDEVLRRFEADLSHPENWLESSDLDIVEILAALGKPNEVYISISGAQPSYFNIALSYETLGTLIRYTYFFESEQLTQGDEPIPLCGSWRKTYAVDIWIQAVDEDFYNALLGEKLRLGESESTEETVYRAFWPLERMTNWNIEDFTQFLAENPEWCFDALSSEELLEAGYSY